MNQLTSEEIRAGDDLAPKAQRMWLWLLAGGVLSVLFGFFVLSYEAPSIFALAFFAGAYFVVSGFYEIAGSFTMARHRWLYLIMGIISIGAGTTTLAWPGITLFVIATLIGWVLLFWGITDIVNGPGQPLRPPLVDVRATGSAVPPWCLGASSPR